jgi:hypothetical protein
MVPEVMGFLLKYCPAKALEVEFSHFARFQLIISTLVGALQRSSPVPSYEVIAAWHAGYHSPFLVSATAIRRLVALSVTLFYWSLWLNME